MAPALTCEFRGGLRLDLGVVDVAAHATDAHAQAKADLCSV